MPILNLPSQTFTLLTNGTGFIAGHKSGSAVVFVVSDTLPVTFSKDTPVLGSVSNKSSIAPTGLLNSNIYAYAINGDAVIEYTPTYSIVDSTIVSPDLPSPIINTLSSSQVEAANAQGRSFSFQQQYDLTSGQTVYFGATMPTVASGYLAAFRVRYIKGVDGEIQTAINQGVTSSVTGGTPITVRTENRYKVKAPFTKFYYLGTTAPTGGTWVEPDISESSGSGSNKSGSPFPSGSYRVYNQGDVAAIRVVNGESQTNRLIIGYSWLEVPVY